MPGLQDARLVTGATILWCACLLGLLTSLGSGGSLKLSWGPGPDLAFAGVPVRTWPAWGCVMAVAATDTLISVWSSEIISPWLYFNVYDKERRDMEFSPWTAQVIAGAWNLYVNIHPLLAVYLAFTQVDIVAVRICLELVASVFAVRGYIRAKAAVPQEDDSAV